MTVVLRVALDVEVSDSAWFGEWLGAPDGTINASNLQRAVAYYCRDAVLDSTAAIIGAIPSCELEALDPAWSSPRALTVPHATGLGGPAEDAGNDGGPGPGGVRHGECCDEAAS